MNKIWKKTGLLFIGICLSFMLAACASSDEAFTESEETEMVLTINDKEIPVFWEDNDTVDELKGQLAEGNIVVEMSMYGGNEQVGPLGKSFTRSDRQTTTHNGDIVLYSGDQIVVFYGSNSWAYTRLGKMELSEEEVTEMLSHDNVQLELSLQ